jgi:hypothetical protein
MFRPLQFSLRTLMVATVYAAVVAAGFHAGTRPWANIVCTVTVGLLLVATLAAIFLTDSRRYFWRGFCVVAWIYAYFAFSSTTVTLKNRLLTHKALEQIQWQVGPMQAAQRTAPGFELQQLGSREVYWTGPGASYVIFGPDSESWETTQQVGHCAWAFLLGLIGGCLALYFHRDWKPHSNVEGRSPA